MSWSWSDWDYEPAGFRLGAESGGGGAQGPDALQLQGITGDPNAAWWPELDPGLYTLSYDGFLPIQLEVQADGLTQVVISPPERPLHPARLAAGRPTWHPLAGPPLPGERPAVSSADVYHSNNADFSAREGLNLDPGSRWFSGGAGEPWRAGDLSTSVDGISLTLSLARATPGPGDALRLRLELRSEQRPLLRHVMHRNTNLLPVLFSLEVEGRPVRVERSGGGMGMGGMPGLTLLAQPGAPRVWDLSVRELGGVLQRPMPTRVTLYAAFCPAQHAGVFGGGLLLGVNLPIRSLGLPIRTRYPLVRSEGLRLRWERGRWRADVSKREE